MSFFENPYSNTDPLYVHETTGSITKTWYGEYEKVDKDIRVIFNEPKAEPFMMAVEPDGSELKLQYEWESAKQLCSYQLQQDK